MRRQLFGEGYRFDFFQAVRLLGRLEPDRAPAGYSDRPGSEVVRFQTRNSLEFPPSEIYEIRKAEGENGPVRMAVAFIGMTGPMGPLPQVYTELVLERARRRDGALGDFLDLFHHRIISFFYRAWEKYRFPIAYERKGRDPFTEYLFDLVGMGTAGLRGRLALPDKGLLLYAGLIAQRPHSASAIESILRDFFSIPVRVEQFSGQWLSVDEEYRTRIGSVNSELGLNAMCGERVWNAQSKFRVRVGPLRLEEFKSFLPPGAGFAQLTDLTRVLAGMEIDFDVQLVLKASEVPACRLETSKRQAPMLGWTTWLKTQDLAEDASEVVLSIAS